MNKAKNKCVDCSYEWEDFSGGNAQQVFKVGVDIYGRNKYEALCPNCKGKYWVWTNYKR
jgi:uncharacterized protein with PIN domain